MTKSQPNITIYSADWCQYCHQAKYYFKSKGLKFTDKDIDKDPKAAQEMVEKSQQRSIPVIDINGEIIVGYDLAKINATLQNAS